MPPPLRATCSLLFFFKIAILPEKKIHRRTHRSKIMLLSQIGIEKSLTAIESVHHVDKEITFDHLKKKAPFSVCSHGPTPLTALIFYYHTFFPPIFYRLNAELEF